MWAIPSDVRSGADDLAARMNRIRTTLGGLSCSQERRTATKDELAALSKEAAYLWSLL
jgi:hypothetical protein